MAATVRNPARSTSTRTRSAWCAVSRTTGAGRTRSWPISTTACRFWRVQRGLGTWPVFVRSVHGAVFADAGQAWSREFHSRDVRLSFGIELSADTVLGYGLPVTLTAGAAWRHDGVEDRQSGAMFARVGRAF